MDIDMLCRGFDDTDTCENGSKDLSMSCSRKAKGLEQECPGWERRPLRTAFAEAEWSCSRTTFCYIRLSPQYGDFYIHAILDLSICG